MTSVLIHRVKTDLTVDHARSLQSAAINHALKFSRSKLGAEIKDADTWLADLKSRAASEALAIHQRMFSLKKSTTLSCTTSTNRFSHNLCELKNKN